MQQHIGIGSAQMIDEIRIRWPTSYGSEQIFRNVKADQFFVVQEGSEHMEPTTRKTFTLGQTIVHHEQATMPGMPMSQPEPTHASTEKKP